MTELGPQLHALIESALSPLEIEAIVARRRRRRARRRLGVAVATTTVVAIGGVSMWALGRDSGHSVVAVNVVPPASTSTTYAPATSAQRYRIDALVEQDQSHGPELCIFPVATVLSRFGSDCAGPKITNWDWSTAPDPKRAEGKTSGQYRLVGTYDGHVFTLTERPAAGHLAPAPNPTAVTPCPTPPGGWNTTDASKVGFSDFQALQNTAQGAPDYAGTWLDPSTAPPGGPVNDFTHHEVTDIAFTGNIDFHRQQLAAIWGGPICVVQHAHSYSELQALTTTLSRDGKQLGLQVISAGPDEIHNVVELTVVAATDATQRKIDRRYGAGLVKITSLMRPVP